MNLKNERAKKGSSTLDFPKDYVIIDIETTGFSPEHDSIIELSAIKICDFKITDKFTSLVKPKNIYYDEEKDSDIDYLTDKHGKKYFFIDSFITELTGITNKMLEKAGTLEEILPKFLNFIGDFHIVGHNVNFDINFIYDNCMSVLNTAFSNDFTDTMQISRKILNKLPHHRLCDIAEYYKISYEGAHRALTDCEITQKCFLKLHEDVIARYSDVETFKTEYKYCNHSTEIDIASIKATTDKFDKFHPLYNKYVCFTGTLEKIPIKSAMEMVVNFGGIIENDVTKNTNFLVLGNNDYCSTIKDGKSSKHKKAEALILKGQDIQILPENVFYDMISE